MPLDILCPSCRSPFPVTNDGPEFHVECPACDAGIGVSVAHPDAGKIGSVPRAVARLAAAPAVKRVPAAAPAARGLDDDAPTRRKGGTSAWVVIVGSAVGLVLVLGGVGTTGYFLFTNLDTDDPPARGVSAVGGSNKVATSNPPQPRPGGIAPRPGTPPAFNPPTRIPPRPNVAAPTAGPIAFKSAPVTPFPITPPALAEDVVTIKLPDSVNAIHVGGGGRFLVMATRSFKLIVFDVSLGRVTAEAQLEREQSKFAAGMNTVVVGYPARRVLRHYTLPDLAPAGETPVPLPAGQLLVGLALGSASNGPMFVSGYNDILLFDLESRSAVGGSAERTTGPPLAFGAEYRAAHAGPLFVSSFINSLQTFKVENGSWVLGRATIANPPFVGAAADLLYGDGQLFTPDGEPSGPPVSSPARRAYLVPAAHGPQFLKMSVQRASAATKGRPVAALTVHADRDADTPVATLGEFPELVEVLPGIASVPLDRQLFFVPDAKLLAVVPPTRDKIILRRLKL